MWAQILHLSVFKTWSGTHHEWLYKPSSTAGLTQAFIHQACYDVSGCFFLYNSFSISPPPAPKKTKYKKKTKKKMLNINSCNSLAEELLHLRTWAVIECISTLLINKLKHSVRSTQLNWSQVDKQTSTFQNNASYPIYLLIECTLPNQALARVTCHLWR